MKKIKDTEKVWNELGSISDEIKTLQDKLESARDTRDDLEHKLKDHYGMDFDTLFENEEHFISLKVNSLERNYSLSKVVALPGKKFRKVYKVTNNRIKNNRWHEVIVKVK